MNNLDLFMPSFLKIIWNFKVPLIYIIVGLALLGRREKYEEKRMAKAAERDKVKRIHC